MFKRTTTGSRIDTRMRRRGAWRSVLCLALLLTAVIAAPSVRAADPTGAQQRAGVNRAAQQVASGGSSGVGKDSAAGPLNSPLVGGLPFTGLDLVALGAVAVALFSLGLALHRLSPIP